MKAIKRAFYGSIVLGACGFFALGSFNSFDISYRKHSLKNDFNIKFAKRIDDMTGEVVVGRMAASIPKWNPFQNKKKVVAQKPKKVEALKPEVKEEKKPEVAKAEPAVIERPEATVKDVPSAQLVAGLYNKTPLENIPKGAGEVSVTNGVISSLSVSFPDGRVFNPTFSRDEMVGNVFEYEDTGTNELKSGLMYEIAEGHYMVTFTDDSVFNTVRLEFKTDQALKQPKQNVNWAMNEQNQDSAPVARVNGDYKKAKKDDDNLDVYEEDNEEFINDDQDSFQDSDYARNADDGEFTEQEAEEDYLEEDPVAKAEVIKKQTYAFSFNGNIK